MSEIAHIDMLYRKEFKGMDDYPHTFDWWMVEKRAEAEQQVAQLEAQVEALQEGHVRIVCLCGRATDVRMSGNNNADGKDKCICDRRITVHLRRPAGSPEQTDYEKEMLKRDPMEHKRMIEGDWSEGVEE